MPNKVVPFIVEGQSDECVVDAFDEILSDVRVHFQGISADGDIALYKIHPENFHALPGKGIQGKIKGLIKREISKSHEFKERDILAVALLMDLDGALIPDDRVAEGRVLEYMADEIRTSDVPGIRLRNSEKKTRIGELIAEREILFSSRKVPFRAFFMSRNLEHALWNISDNLTGEQGKEEKRQLSLEFIEHCEEDPAFFKQLLLSSDLLHGADDYKASWDWAFRGVNSLKRGSNVGLLPDEFGISWPDEDGCLA